MYICYYFLKVIYLVTKKTKNSVAFQELESLSIFALSLWKKLFQSSYNL